MKGKWFKITHAFLATVLTASLLLSYFPGTVLRSLDELAPTSELNAALTDSFGNTYTFKATYGEDAGIPEGAELFVQEITEGPELDAYLVEVQTALESGEIEYAHLFDISIVKDGVEYQPAEGASVSMQIALQNAPADDLDVVHFSDESGSGEVVENSTTSEGDATVVAFEAESFSVYAVVKALPPERYMVKVQDQAELAQNYGDLDGFILSYDGDHYATNSLNGNGALIEKTSINQGSVWFLESNGVDNQYYIYTMISGAKKYIRNDSGNNTVTLSFSDTPVTAFEFQAGKSGTYFYIKKADENKWLQHSGSGSGLRMYGSNSNDTNAQLSLTYASTLGEPQDDYYQLNGKTYSIVFVKENINGAGLLTTARAAGGVNRLGALEMVVQRDVLGGEGELLISDDADLPDWTFQNISKNKYYVTTEIGGTTRYLTLSGTNLTLESTPTADSVIEISSGSGAYSGKYTFSVNGYYLTLVDGAAANGFGSVKNSSANSWINLATKSPLTQDDFVVYSAEKVDLSDRVEVPDGAQVVIYTRIWNDTKKTYEFYVVNHDGALIRAYESGSMIQWVGSEINTALWDFTEYTYDDGSPNFYYELQNTYSGKYIAPQVTGGQILSNNTIGINLDGRRFGYYYSTIVAWDSDYYSYAGLKAENGQLVSCPLSEADSFYFAILDPTHAPNDLTTVTTIDHTIYGVSMKIIDFDDYARINNQDTSQTQYDYIGSTVYNQNQGEKNLLSTNLVDDYPVATKTNLNLKNMFASATEVNHLFIENTYFSSGYFEFDSTQNFASFYDKDGNYDPQNFTVYKELGTANIATSRDSLQHGQFLPFNKLSDQYSTANPYNLYNAKRELLPDSDPRKGEPLRLVDGETDYYFALEIETSFTQTPDGCDDWGHDIIYEFTGDDDFWLYVDGELIIDLGGIHSALEGHVNYATGRVVVNGVEKTLRQIFTENYKKRNPDWTQAEVDAYLAQYFEPGETIFKPYSTHTMRIFFMERGAGASNLHMRFNLASVKPGTILLNKEVSGVSDPSSFVADYPFQIYYKLQDGTEERLAPNNGLGISVQYKDTNRDVTYQKYFTASDGTQYEDVFLLKPGEYAEIDFPDKAMTYYVKECNIDPNMYDVVTANDVVLTGVPVGGSSIRKDYSCEYAEVGGRTRLTFDNHVVSDSKGTLTITKELYDETGTTRIYKDQCKETFDFRLYLGTENDAFSALPAADHHSYSVKDENGNYCVWNAGTQQFDSLGISDWSLLSDTQKAQATFKTSMNGSISKIPVDYTVEIREIQGGARYKVEERYYEIPDGYTLQKFVVNGVDMYDVAQGTIIANTNAEVIVRNLKGWGIRVMKEWTDADYIVERDPTYFAMYIDDGTGNLTFVNDSVKQLVTGAESAYWFMESLNGVPFANYVIREVVPSNANPTVDAQGNVTNYGTLTILVPNDSTDPNNSFSVYGKQYGDPDRSLFTYSVKYQEGTPGAGSSNNVRIDTMINTRVGIEIYKVDWNGQPIADAVFTLKDGNGNDAGAATYTSDANGLITIAYLRDSEEYTLKEIASPTGYSAMQGELKITRTGNTVSVVQVNGDAAYYTLDDTDTAESYATITIRNKPFTLTFKKTQDNKIDPLADAVFALYRQVAGVNGPRRDYTPIDGFTQLTTGADGIVPLLTQAFQDGTLTPGTYYLSEVTSPTNYLPVGNDVIFTVSAGGIVTIEAGSPSNVELQTVDTTSIAYTVIIPNDPFETRTLTVSKEIAKGTTADTSGMHSFSFTARLYMPDGVTPWNFGEFTNGSKSFALAHGDSLDLEIPLGGIVTITEDTQTGYTTAYRVNNVVTTDNRYTVTVTDDSEVTFVNTRQQATINLQKKVVGTGGSFTFTVHLQDEGIDCAGYEIYSGVFTGADGTAQITLTPGNDKTVNRRFSIPYGSTLTIEETPVANYTTTVKVGNAAAQDGLTASLSESQTKTTNTITVLFTNTEEQSVPVTGVKTDTKTYMWLLCLAVPLFIPVLLGGDDKKKKKSNKKTNLGNSNP